MIKEVIASGQDVIEAKENARAALGAGPLDDVQFEVIYAGKKGFLGFMSKPAQVRAFIETPDKADAPRRERRHDKKNDRRNRPEGEKKPQRERAEKPEKAEKTDKPAKKEKANNSAKKSVVIPECNLKLEKREVSAGEDMSYDFVTTLLQNVGLNAEATLYSCDDGTRRITITGEDASSLIGHHGDTLDALQYLANLASAKKNANGERDKSRVTIDIEGYRAKREETLRALARRMAQKALKNRRSVMLEPLSAYERRIIHSEIQNIEGVSTNSVGSDNNRKIVIYLTDKKPQGIFDDDAATESVKAQTAPTVEEDAEVVNATAYDATAAAESDDENATDTVLIENTAPAIECQSCENDCSACEADE